MDDSFIEIRNNEINVEEIMQKIRENIRRRQIAGEVPPDPDSVIASPSRISPKIELDDSIQGDLSFINANWDIHNNSYFISSHNPYIGKFLVKGRQIVHGEIRRYVDPMVSRQTQFNASTTRIISLISQQYLELDHRQQDFEAGFSSYKQNSDKMLVDSIATAKNELDLKIESASNEIATVKENLDLKIESASNELATAKEIFSRMDDDMDARAWLVHALEDRFQKALKQKSAPLASSRKLSNYFLFEERFRGSRNVITQRQEAFLPYFEKCSQVLDIGCGRGEFLEILRNNAIGSSGIDSDPDMVAYCRSRHLDVVQSDAIRYLETLEDKSLDGIFIDQVVEHLESDYLIRLIALCYQKLKFGYYIVIETVNPTSFVSFVNFYIDMTHKRPVHPETLQYLISAAGFRECEKKYFSAVSDEDRLKKFEGSPDADENERRNVDVYNRNIEKLNSILFGAQDYAVVGKK